MKKRQSVPEWIRFWQKVLIVDRGFELGECWEWTACANNKGYGTFRPIKNGKLWLAHRYAYETIIGMIPIKLELDHLCHNTLCVRPVHLEPVTHAENIRRALTKTHCIRGHELVGNNLYFFPSGKRQCRLCHNIRRMLTYYRQKER